MVKSVVVLVMVVVAAVRVGVAQVGAMPGMPMGPPTHGTIPKPRGAAGKQAPSDGKRRGERAPGRPGEEQRQATDPGMTTMPRMPMDGQDASARTEASETRDTLRMQEPESPGRRTGEDLPAPDLLKEVVARSPMELKDFVASATSSNPTIAEADALARRSEAQARQAGLPPNPTVGYQGDQIRGGSYGGGEQGAFVQQSLVLGGKLGLRRRVYVEQGRSDQIGVEEQTYRVKNDVAQAFYTALASQGMVVARQRLLKVATDAVETVHQLANVGQADAPDILQAEVEAEQAKIDYVSAEREYLQSFRALAVVAGEPAIKARPLQGSLEGVPEMDAEAQVGTIVNGSPTVKRMQQEIATSEARVRAAKREAVPDLTLRAGEQYSFEQVSALPARPVGPQSFATASVNLPLWNRNQGNVSAAEIDTERARKGVERERLRLRQTAEPLAQSYLASRFTAERYKTQLIPRAQRAYELYLKKYEGMAGAYPQVLVSQRTLFQLQIGYLVALRDEWKSVVALENYTLSGGLAAPVSNGTAGGGSNLPSAVGGGVE